MTINRHLVILVLVPSLSTRGLILFLVMVEIVPVLSKTNSFALGRGLGESFVGKEFWQGVERVLKGLGI